MVVDLVTGATLGVGHRRASARACMAVGGVVGDILAEWFRPMGVPLVAR